MTQWTITRDHLADPQAQPGTNANAVGLVGPRGATLTADEIVVNPKAVAFRLYDDDRVICYQGYLLGEDEFAPQDDFGEPNAGCTHTEIKGADGEWRWL